MIDDLVRATCKDIFGGRFFPTTFMQKDGGLPQFPAGRFTIVGGVTYEDVCGTGPDDSTDDTRVQIDVAASTKAERKTLTAQVIAAMDGLTDPPCSRLGPPIEDYDEPTRTYRAILEFMFYPSSLEET